MITKWKLFNFKSVRDETELELGPLTIFAGPNSSGKSTWTQSMLLITQTLASKVSSRSVVLNGHLIKLGQFDDLRSYKSEADQILIGWECKPRNYEFASLQNAFCEIAFDVDPSSPQRDLMQLQPRLFSCTLAGLVRDEDNVDKDSYLLINRTGPNDIAGISEAVSPNSLDYSVELDTDSLEELCRQRATREPIGCELSHFLPDRIAIRINRAQEEAEELVSIICDFDFVSLLKGVRYRRNMSRGLSGREMARYISKEAVISIPVSVTNLLKERLGKLVQPIFETAPQQLSLFSEDATPLLTSYDWYVGVQELSKQTQDKLYQAIQEHKEEISTAIHQTVLANRKNPYTFSVYSLPENLSVFTDYLNYFFSNSVKYLGPLRDEPKALYPLAASVDPSDVGLRGEYTAAVLDLHKENFISYLPTANFTTPAVKVQPPSSRSLRAAVLDWLQYMGVAEDVQTQDRGKLGHELKVTTLGTEMAQDLTHVGVGVSQVLPILVMCLLADRDTTLIIEQPELHLHPKVQTLLADFFLSMALLGKQCIVETHSEYIINRLRFRIASAPEETLSSIAKIFFVEKKEGISSFRDVVVNKYGAIPDWPEGFFDQSQAEAEEILRAATLKRKRDRGVNKDA